ncbi:MAG: SpoIIE family protein phosphatase [Flavobacteriales bacterium]|nr:SpoIIE family protein phosphatase [Flavobacteriales bacterium]
MRKVTISCLYFFITILTLLNVCFAQFNVDSLKNELANEQDEKKMIHLRNLIGEYGEIGRYGYWDSIILDAEKIDYKSGLIYSSFMQSLNYSKKGIIDQAVSFSEKALTIATSIKDSIWMGYAIEHLGHLNSLLGETSTSIEYFKQAHQLYLSRKDQWRIGHVLIRIAEIYQEQGDVDESMKLYRESIGMFKITKDTSGLTLAYNHIGRVFREKKQLDSALFYMHKSLALRENFQDQYYLPYTLNDLALTYFELGKLDRMFDYLTQSEKEVDRIGDEAHLRQSLYELYLQYYRTKKDYKNALKYKDLSVEIRDSLNTIDNQKATIKQETKYKYERQKAEDDAKNEKLLAVEKEAKEKQKIITFSTAGGLGLVAIFLIFVFNRLQITKKQKKVIERQKEIVEEKNQEIMDSITYAKRIQNAILPPQKVVKEYLQRSFILYKPKDVVAGDFYWMESSSPTLPKGKGVSPPSGESEGAVILFAAADCTGHGVPGAMVSVICNNGLNRSVREYGLTDPGEILNKTREIVVQEFEKSEEDVKDGMDIALCSLEQEEGNWKLKYAGAHNPLWVIRKGGNEVEEIKANKQPIGKFENPEPYTTHAVELEQGDTIYIFSDGYVDQFGGEKGKKFKAKAFRELLLSIQEKTMDEQKSIIDEAFESWRGGLEQIDDVCIIGVRI